MLFKLDYAGRKYSRTLLVSPRLILTPPFEQLMSTRLLENMVTFTIPSDFAGRLFPERSPALRNGRGEYALPYVSGMEVTMTFIRSLEHGWRLRETTTPKQRVPMSLRFVLILRAQRC